MNHRNAEQGLRSCNIFIDLGEFGVTERLHVSKEGVPMATRHFESSNAATFSESVLSTLLMSGYSAPLRLARVVEPAGIVSSAEWRQEAIEDLHALGRGVRWAFAIEGGFGLLIYAVWCFWHLWL